MRFESSILQRFKGFTIYSCQIHLPLENKSMFLHPNVSFSIIFFEFPCFFHYFIFWWKKTKKLHSLYRQYFFSLKLHKLPIFMLLSLFYDNIFIFL